MLAKRKFKNGDNIIFYDTDGTKLPLQNNTIDTVLSQEAITHSPNKYEVFKEIYRILKPNGTLIFQDWFQTNLYLSKKTDLEYKSHIEPLINYINILKRVGFYNIIKYYPLPSENYTDSKLGFKSLVLKMYKIKRC